MPLPVPVAGLAETLQGLGWTVGLALLSTLLATLEYGWQNLSRARLAQGGGTPAARDRLRALLEQGDRAETALLVLRVASQMALVLCLYMLAERLLPRWWPEAGADAALLTALATAFVWITLFCRVMPAELSLEALEVLVRATMPAIVLAGRVLAPPVDLFRRLLRIATGSTPQAEARQYADEVLATIEEGEAEGHLGEHQADMIEKVLALRAMEVRRLMTPRTEVDVIDVASSIGQAREIALRTGRSRYPLVEAGDVDRVVGVVHVKDLLSLGRDEPVVAVRREAWFVPESKPITELLADFRRHRSHLAVVLDEYGGTSGLITIEDVLEEIVGDIDDEFDVDEEPEELEIVDAHHAVAPGGLRLDELNAQLSIRLPESDDYDTLGGYVFHTLGRLPEVGDTVRHEQVVLTVRSVVERRVDRVEIEILQTVG